MQKIEINPDSKHKTPPYLFMQFMEPLGNTDASVEAGWDFVNQQWSPELIKIIKELNPGCIRWGGCFTSYWKWKESIGDRKKRKPMINYLWGGIESNQIGIHEILNLCELTNSKPLIAVNFKSDGRPQYIKKNREGTPKEAAELVSYCNNPNNNKRISNGKEKPWKVKLWQIGNETSYPLSEKRFTEKENVEYFLKFAQAMKNADPAIKLIGWGGQERGTGKWWIETLINKAEKYLDFIAFHMMQQSPQKDKTVLSGMEYSKDRSKAWKELNDIYDSVKAKLKQARNIMKKTNSEIKIAITEGHLSLKPHNRNFILNEWLAGLYHAKIMNLYIRNSDLVKISTLSDFFGNRWRVNSIYLGENGFYLTPSGIIMKFFKKHIGKNILSTPNISSNIDISASKTKNNIFLHIVNSELTKDAKLDISVKNNLISKVKKHQISPEISTYVDSVRTEAIRPKEYNLSVENQNSIKINIPAASVVSLNLNLKPK